MEHREFKPMVDRIWKQKLGNDPMTGIWQKLQKLKDEARGLNKEMASYEQRLTQIRQNLECTQANLILDPFNQVGDITSVTILQEAFNRFSAASGLQASAEKSSIYIAGVAQHIKEQLIELTGYTEGSIPFKYLGVPLFARKLNIYQCLPLMEKITERVRCWSARMLSYFGRIQLSKSVLFGIQTYWSQIFLLPTKIMKMIETICRTFLWTGSTDCSRKALITRDKICQPRATGGLNVINMKIWNKAALLKHLWALAMKKDTLWIKWAHSYYIKNRDIAEMNTPKIAAWVVKKNIEAREDVKQMRQFIIVLYLHWRA
ncbi:PREDICTED: uncharacterized protein LOC109208247 [Nicotiana attenuata]|uniref:uncharacterized protein LOC109208247 n=1 Tax=Nicotiana attenuata TaxID=49451 RepID=UPI000905625D|nr:PREDICTED: uncharacterized protein LOC109208247 [Nicotiana attenuata]